MIVELLHRRSEQESRMTGNERHQRESEADPGFDEHPVSTQRLHKTTACSLRLTGAKFAAPEPVIAIRGIEGVAPTLHHARQSLRRLPLLFQGENPRHFSIEIFGLTRAPPPGKLYQDAAQLLDILMADNREAVVIQTIGDERLAEIVRLRTFRNAQDEVVIFRRLEGCPISADSLLKNSPEHDGRVKETPALHESALDCLVGLRKKGRVENRAARVNIVVDATSN